MTLGLFYLTRGDSSQEQLQPSGPPRAHVFCGARRGPSLSGYSWGRGSRDQRAEWQTTLSHCQGGRGRSCHFLGQRSRRLDQAAGPGAARPFEAAEGPGRPRQGPEPGRTFSSHFLPFRIQTGKTMRATCHLMTAIGGWLSLAGRAGQAQRWTLHTGRPAPPGPLLCFSPDISEQ